MFGGDISVFSIKFTRKIPKLVKTFKFVYSDFIISLTEEYFSHIYYQAEPGLNLVMQKRIAFGNPLLHFNIIL